MTARMRRLASDYEQIKKDFAGHKNIIVTPIGDEPPEKYHVTYFVNGIYLLPDGRIETLGRHEVEITLHADYPRYKPICKILTPIWHPNFRDGQICIGDIWGAGESLSDIIINIGDMIQYKSWNSFSPLSADAATWAMENKHLFPVGNIDLYIADYASAADTVTIDLLDADESAPDPDAQSAPVDAPTGASEPGDGITDAPSPADAPDAFSFTGNDFDITAEELAGIEFVPTAQRMQTVSHGELVKGNKLNFKTVLVKGLLWALIGAVMGFFVSELLDAHVTDDAAIARLCGYSELAPYYEYTDKADAAFEKAYEEFELHCKKNGLSQDTESFSDWYIHYASDEALDYLDDYDYYDDLADDAIYDAYTNDFHSNRDKLGKARLTILNTGAGVWAGTLALFIGLFLGLGEGIYYGSKEKALLYALIGAGVSLAIGFLSGYLAQNMYNEMLDDDAAQLTAALVRGLGWAVMGLGIGTSVGLIKPELRRILFCAVGGLVGAFIGGFLFNYICKIIPGDMAARGIAVVIMGCLIGVGVGLLEQFAKAAWLKVVRGEFEGKEYLVFAGTTSIGNNGKNTIVLFKDKLVGPHHCDITLEGSKYVLTDCGTPMGTFVNGQKTVRHVLRRGDAIAIGNSVLVFNSK